MEACEPQVLRLNQERTRSALNQKENAQPPSNQEVNDAEPADEGAIATRDLCGLSLQRSNHGTELFPPEPGKGSSVGSNQRLEASRVEPTMRPQPDMAKERSDEAGIARRSRYYGNAGIFARLHDIEPWG
jgi:hypothetical protein